jgi:hypothetical protein
MATRRPTEPPPEKTAAPAAAPTTTPLKPTRPRAKSASATPTTGITPPTSTAAPRARKPAKKATPVAVSEDVRRGMIAEAAYLRAERRGFANGNEHDDWVAAEAEVDALLKARHGGTSQ